MEDKSLLQKLPRILPGLLFMVGSVILLRLYVEPWIKDQVVFGVKGWLARELNLNYILLSIILGMVYRNVIFRGKIPAWAEEGFRTTRLFIKGGVIMLGCLYTVMSLFKVGGWAIVLILGFVFGTVLFVMWFGRLIGMDRSMVGTMGASCGVCGVSACIATAPGVKAKATEVAMAIATILGFGLLTMFFSPFIGKALGLSDLQYGAWVGTGILNSGQVLATCLAFNPTIAKGTAVYYGELWNLVRVISIPFVVFIITAWYWSKEAKEEQGGQGQKQSFGKILKEKFPMFVLGFMVMTVLSTLGVFGPEKSETNHILREAMQWIFAIGLIGQGAYIDFREIKQAGGKPLKIGLAAGATKYVLALVIIKLFVPAEYDI
jgi:uncharacterized integral membrane protein (TIGR00698 family)